MPRENYILYSRDTDIVIQMDEDTLSGPSASFPYTHFKANMNETRNVSNRAQQQVLSLAALHPPKAKEVFT